MTTLDRRDTGPSDLCQTDYERARPDRYFPETFRFGTCAACGDDTYVARVTRAEVAAVRAAIVPSLDAAAIDARRARAPLAPVEDRRW